MTTRARAAYANAADRAVVPGDPAVRRATTLVIVVMCLLALAEAGYGASNDGAGEALIDAAMVVLPLLYVVPATRPLWLRHRYPLLAVHRSYLKPIRALMAARSAAARTRRDTHARAR